MHRSARIPPETWAVALADYRAGATGKEIAARHGIKPHTLYVRVMALGLGKSTGRRGPRSLGAEIAAPPDAPALAEIADFRVRRMHGPEVWAAAKRDYLAGHPAKAVSARHGVSVHALKARMAREGWRRVDRKTAPLHPALPAEALMRDARGMLVSAWEMIARPAQTPPQDDAPDGDWSIWLFQGGRGAGKTRAGAEWLAGLAEQSPGGRFALLGPTLRDVREVMVEGPSGLKHLPGRALPAVELWRGRLVWPNGAQAHFFSAEERERLRGPAFHAAWGDEFCAWSKPDETLALLRATLRLGERPRLALTTTPRAIPAFRALRAEPNVAVTQSSAWENAANLSPGFLDGLEELYGWSDLYAMEVEGLGD